MLTREDVVEIVALHRRGWSISAIARHTGRDRKTVRAWLVDERRRRPRAASVLEPYRDCACASSRMLPEAWSCGRPTLLTYPGACAGCDSETANAAEHGLS